MSLSKTINLYRRKATKSVTKGLLQQKKPCLSNPSHVKRILITRPNHRLGNQLLITALVKEVHEQFPNAKTDLFLKGNLGEIIFENYGYVDHIITLPKKHFKELGRYLNSWFKLRRKKYDLVINAEVFSSSGRISTKVARANSKFFGYERELNLFNTKDAAHISKYAIYSLRYFLNQSIQEKSVPNLEIKLTSEELKESKQLLAEYADLNQPTICLYTFATGNKRYSKTWWADFYKALKIGYPNHNIIEVLPKENVSALDFKIPAFYSKNIRELASFISNTQLFITGDCGIMHLAAATNTPTIGLFNVTTKAMYEPYNKACLGIDTNHKSTDEVCQILNTHVVKHGLH